MAGTLWPQVAYGTPRSPAAGDDKSVSDTIAGWFSGDGNQDGSRGTGAASTGGAPVVPSREKLPKGKAAPQSKRVAELTGKRTANARYWQLSDGRVQAEVSAVPTGYRAGSPGRTSTRRSSRPGPRASPSPTRRTRRPAGSARTRAGWSASRPVTGTR
ncbi:hypothetical protein O1L60_11890 [Streptomyces diastatochromogenes]|nr:hypothetical protein [Streptomyces diastatochromogenes]